MVNIAAYRFEMFGYDSSHIFGGNARGLPGYFLLIAEAAIVRTAEMRNENRYIIMLHSIFHPTWE